MENSCKNCKHFVQHYIINTFNHISPVNCGSCKLRKVTEKERKYFPFPKPCDEWESDEEAKAERQFKLEKDLREICNRLNEILEILKAD